MFCIECGTKLPDNAKFCFQCGAKIGSDNVSGVVDSKPQSKLVPMKCTNCGGYVEFQNNLDTAQCPFCNSTFIVERAINNFTISNGGRDFNLLLGLAESNIKSKLFLDALDYMWQAHILASLTDRQKILEKINDLLDGAYDYACETFKIYILKYKALHGLEEVDSNFIRRVRSYEYSLKNGEIKHTWAELEGHGLPPRCLSDLYLSYNAVVIYTKEGDNQLVFNRNEVQNIDLDRKTKVFSFRYRGDNYCFKTKDPNNTAKFIDYFTQFDSIYAEIIDKPTYYGKYEPLLRYIKRAVDQNDDELNSLISSDTRCSYTPLFSFETMDEQILCFDDEIQVWKLSRYLRPWKHDDLSDFKYFRTDKIDKIEIKPTSILFLMERYRMLISTKDGDTFDTLLEKNVADKLIKFANDYQSRGVSVSVSL